MNISYRHKRPCNANTNFRDNCNLKVRPFSECPDCVLSFELMINILLRYRRCSVLSCCVCIISYWWGKFEIQWKSLEHTFHVNNFSVQERLTRESVYPCDCMKRGFLVRATWTCRKYLTYFGLWLWNGVQCISFIRAPMRTAVWHTSRMRARCGLCDSTKFL